MIEKLKRGYSDNREAILFVVKLLSIYFVLQLSYDHLISSYTKIDSFLINLIVSSAESGLSLLGYELIPSNSIYKYHIGIAGTSGVIIGSPCDGLSLFILYTSFLLVFKGKWWVKMIFITIGVLLIHILNVGRIIALALIVKYYPESLDFHHSYTFTLFVYLFIFVLWILRVRIYKHRSI